MRPRKYQQLVEAVRQCRPEVILLVAGHCDGHAILKPQALVDAGLPVAVVEYLTTTHRSDGTPKGSIFVAGKAVNELTGVYGLDLLRFFARALGIEYRDAIGRGFEARNIQMALRDHFKATTPSAAP